MSEPLGLRVYRAAVAAAEPLSGLLLNARLLRLARIGCSEIFEAQRKAVGQ